MPNEIYKIKVGNTTYDLRDDRVDSLTGISFILSTDAATTPSGITWGAGSSAVTGTLTAANAYAASPGSIYLVPTNNESNNDILDEYISVAITDSNPTTYRWERLGNTEIDFSSLGALARKDSVTLNKQTDVVLGETTTFTNSTSAVSFSGGDTDTFVKSYPGVSKYLGTTTLTGVNASSTTTASKATKGTDITGLAKRAASQTTVGNANVGTATSLMKNAKVTGTTLEFEFESVTPAAASTTKIYGCDSTGTATVSPYTFTDVTVPIKDTNATTVATGGLADSGTSSILVGLGTATTAAAVTAVGTATAAAQTITVGTNDKVTVLKNTTDITVS